MYFVVLDGKQHKVYGSNEYVEAMEEAAQLDWIQNSPELNDGVKGTHIVQVLTLPEMMMSDVEMVIWPAVRRGIKSPAQQLPPNEGGLIQVNGTSNDLSA